MMRFFTRYRSWQLLGAVASLSLAVSTLFGQTLFVPGTLGTSTNSGVGIGTNSPIGQLMVQATNPYLTLNSSVAGKQSGLLFYDVSNGAWMIGNNYNNAGDHNLYIFRSGAAGNMLFAPDGNGNVGIGTNAPLDRLQVIGAVRINPGSDGQALKVLGRGTDNFSQLAFYSADGSSLNSVFQSLADGTIAIANGTTISEKLRITPQGSVGIGTTAPIRPLHLAGPTGTEVVLEGSDGQTNYKKWNFYVAGPAGTGKGLFLRILNDAGTASTIDSMCWGSNGNVGIGTTSPTQKLSVNGTVRAKEVIVDTNWSDFVFDQNYKLPTLQEVERHIQLEKHLPGIPSAEEVHQHGISLGEMQARLLEKIEELTLHQIQQEKALKVMQAENLELKRRISAGGL